MQLVPYCSITKLFLSYFCTHEPVFLTHLMRTNMVTCLVLVVDIYYHRKSVPLLGYSFSS